jgi:hypothetical protein
VPWCLDMGNRSNRRAAAGGTARSHPPEGVVAPAAGILER